MPPEASNTQVVFLIDVSLCRNGETKWDEAVSLAVFRILSFLNCQLQSHWHVVNKTKPKSLRWGYKLFDIDEKLGKAESRIGFHDFKLKTFQEFEKCLKKCFQHVKEADAHAAMRSDQHQEQKKKGFLVPSHPSLCLSKRLTETVHDFSWEMPDVGSPVKGKKTPGRQFETPEPSNFVFLISRIPCDKKSLRHFCNKVVMDKNVFIDSFMPPSLRKQFYDEHKIQLHWIDVGRYQIWNEASTSAMAADKKSYEIIRRSLRMVGGLLIPLHSLITYLTPTAERHSHAQSSDAQDGSDITTGTGGAIDGKISGRDHVTILLSSFACTSVCSALVPCGRGRRSGTSGQRSTDTAATMATLIFEELDEDGRGSRNVSLKLVPITRKAPKRHQVGSLQMVEVRTSDHSDSACVLVTPPPGKTPHHPHTPTTTHLQVRACMERAQVRRLGAHLGQHFLCFAAENATTEQRGALSSLLHTLHSRQQALILSVTLDKQTCPYLAVLEGSSSTTAHLTYLSLGMTLQVEKQMTLQPPAPPGGQGAPGSSPPSGGISLEEFRDRAANAMAERAAEKQCGKEQGVSERMSCSGDGEGGGLWTGVLNPWHMVGSVPQIQSALNSLTDRLQEQTTPSGARGQLLGDLKEAYRQENQTPFLLHPSLQSTPVFPTSSSFLRGDSVDRSNSSCGEPLSAPEGRKSVKRHESILTRGRLMVMKARSMTSVCLAQDEVNGQFVSPVVRHQGEGPFVMPVVRPQGEGPFVMPVVRPEAGPFVMPVVKPEAGPALQPDISQADVCSADDLRYFVRQEYRRALAMDTDLTRTVHTLVTFPLQFMTAQDSSCPQRCAARFLEEKLLKPYQEHRVGMPKPAPQEDDSERVQRLKELKLQALLRLEVESMCSQADQTDQMDQMDQAERQQARQQIVDLLRSLMFGLGPKPALEFISTMVLHNYLATLPELLVTIYDELMQPLPRALRRQGALQTEDEEDLSSDDTSSSLATDDAALLSIASSDLSTASPRRSSRTRSGAGPLPVLPRISSQRQIEVKAPPAGKAKGGKGKKGSKGKGRTDRTKTPTKQKGGKKTRRNLFNTDLCKVPPKDDAHTSRASRKKQPPSSERPRGRQKTFVAETPRHRQRGRLSRQREGDEGNQPSGPQSHVKVVEESPFKETEGPGVTPGRYKAPRRVLRSSFYSRGRHSRSLTRALENPHNISGRHHVPHLKASKPGQLAEALGVAGVSSPRRQVTALLNPVGASPDLRSPELRSPELRSPAFSTRSRTPTRSGGRPLFHDTRSMPAFPSAAKILDFRSPVKRSPAVTIPPRAGRGPRALLAHNTAAAHTDSVHPLTPTKGRVHPPTPTKGRVHPLTPTKGRVHPLTPTKGRRAAASGVHTPTKQQSVSKHRAQGSTPSKQAAGVTSLEGGGRSTPRQPGRGQDAQISPQGASPRESSQHSSGMNYTSPTRRPASSKVTHFAGLLASNSENGTSAAPTKARRELLSPVRPAATRSPGRQQQFLSAVRTPTKGAGARTPACGGPSLSPVKTPSKSILRLSPACGGPFGGPSLSPVKTPSKSILRLSPAFGGPSLSPVKTPSKSILSPSRQRGLSTTPHGSPRVSFSVKPDSPPAVSDRAAETPDKWQRRKRRRSGGPGKSPSSSPSAAEGKTPGEHTGDVLLRDDSRLDDVSQGFAVAGPSRVATSRKRSSVLSEPDSPSSLCKRQKVDRSGVAGVSRPSLFSENAVDSYFSACSDDVFLGPPSDQHRHHPLPSDQHHRHPPPSLGTEQWADSQRPESPLFKGRTQERGGAGGAEGGRLFDFASRQSSTDSMAGSQGFEAVMVATREDQHPPSPTFSTSPVLKRHCSVSRNRDGGQASGRDSRTDPQSKPHPAVYQRRLREASSTEKAGPCGAGSGAPSGCVIQALGEGPSLTVKGVVVTCSPRVSSSSLAQLISSPLLLPPSGLKRAREEEGGGAMPGDAVTSPRQKKSRKKLEM